MDVARVAPARRDGGGVAADVFLVDDVEAGVGDELLRGGDGVHVHVDADDAASGRVGDPAGGAAGAAGEPAVLADVGAVGRLADRIEDALLEVAVGAGVQVDGGCLRLVRHRLYP